MDEHPLVYFRDGAAGRRPALLGTRLDVADVIETIRQNDNSVEAAAPYLELRVDRVEACLRYYADYRSEIDEWIDRAHAIAERADLIGLGDEELFRRMLQEERASMTNNVKDFVPLANQAALEGDDHFGPLLTSDRSLPRNTNAIGRVVEVLDEFLQGHPSKDGCRNRVVWVGPTRRG